MENKKLNENLKKEELLDAGSHMGHISYEVHQKARFILKEIPKKKSFSEIDLDLTLLYFDQVKIFLQKYIQNVNDKVLWVGGKDGIGEIVKKYANVSNGFYMINKWKAGILSNFDVTKKNIENLKSLVPHPNDNTREQKKIYRKKDKLETIYSGIKYMTQLPKVMFVINVKKYMIAIKEAKNKGIPVIGLLDTDANPTLLDFFIPANDDTSESVELICQKISNIIVNNVAK